MTIYKFQIFGTRAVSTKPWGMWRLMWSHFKARPLHFMLHAKFYWLVIGRSYIDENTRWRIARDLRLCPDCGDRVTETLRGRADSAEVVYDCDCGYSDCMDIS